MSQPGGWPTRARVLIAAVILVGAVTLAFRLPDIAAWTLLDLGLCAGLVALVAIGELFQLELPYRSEKVTFSISDAIWTA
ncbi:MAG: hypothetical protein H0T66_04885, partial [Geodermatophilaceae bacterium]|nr:hypothetical protein [Geodermatophilaceae bacterium]